jgi:hypothetical protein
MFGDVYSNRDPSPGTDSPLLTRLLLPSDNSGDEGSPGRGGDATAGGNDSYSASSRRRHNRSGSGNERTTSGGRSGGSGGGGSRSGGSSRRPSASGPAPAASSEISVDYDDSGGERDAEGYGVHGGWPTNQRNRPSPPPDGTHFYNDGGGGRGDLLPRGGEYPLPPLPPRSALPAAAGRGGFGGGGGGGGEGPSLFRDAPLQPTPPRARVYAFDPWTKVGGGAVYSGVNAVAVDP